VTDGTGGAAPQGTPPVLRAAGAVPWRHQRGQLQVALVHRPRYDDWAWAKGKLDPDEQFPVAAAREVEEETGYTVRLGRRLPTSTYTLLDRSGAPVTKEVRYWAAEVIGGDGILQHEIDDVAWLDVAAASARLDYARDRDQLRAAPSTRGSSRPGRWPWSGTRTPYPAVRGPATTTGSGPWTVRARSGPARSARCSVPTTSVAWSPPTRPGARTRLPRMPPPAAHGCTCARGCPRRGTRRTLPRAWRR
jgi:8-oxo-dGTP pyrophosphatase MutT (NUDIX family)